MVSESIKSPEVITATYKIITPMFIGDANQKASWISPLSFKGALRFWWRALAWGRIRSKQFSDEEALKELRANESLLFGDTETGKGIVSVKLTQPKIKILSDWPPNNPNSPSAYLAYGLTGDKSNPHRQAIQENVTFDVTLIYQQQQIDKQQNGKQSVNELRLAIQALGLFGGLGSRARRALGAVQLTHFDNAPYIIADEKDYQRKTQAILNGYDKADVAPYSAFSKDSLFKVNGAQFSNARDAHAKLGEMYKGFRGQPSELRGARKKVFGLPLKGVDEKSRRGSPLFFHVAQFANNQFGFAVLYLPTSVFYKEHRHNKVEWNLTKDFVESIGD